MDSRKPSSVSSQTMKVRTSHRRSKAQLLTSVADVARFDEAPGGASQSGAVVKARSDKTPTPVVPSRGPDAHVEEAQALMRRGRRGDETSSLAAPQTLSIATFCARNGIGLTLYHKLKQQGRGPREMRLGRTIRITLDAERDWQREREFPSDAEARLIAREQKARVGLARRAGKIAAASPKHISRRRRQEVRRG